MMRRNALIAAGVLLVFVAAAVAQGITTPGPPPFPLPNVKVTAPRLEGGNVLCRGEACAGMLTYMKMIVKVENLVAEGMIEDETVEGGDFCGNLRRLRPNSECRANTAPSTPGITTPGRSVWQANGCGDSRRTQMMGSVLFNIVSSESYSGNFDAPYPGVSFNGACNTHDSCWAAGNSRAQCDSSFYASMRGACNQLNDGAAINVCTGYAGLYHGGVATTNPSNSAYAQSIALRECSIWGQDMRDNNCGN